MMNRVRLARVWMLMVLFAPMAASVFIRLLYSICVLADDQLVPPGVVCLGAVRARG